MQVTLAQITEIENMERELLDDELFNFRVILGSSTSPVRIKELIRE